MAIDVNAAEKALEKMTVPQLKQRYAKVYGEETRTHHKVLLIKRILWRMQALREGASRSGHASGHANWPTTLTCDEARHAPNRWTRPSPEPTARAW